MLMSNEDFSFSTLFSFGSFHICSHIERPHDHSFLRPLAPPRRSRGGQPTRSFSLCLFVMASASPFSFLAIFYLFSWEFGGHAITPCDILSALLTVPRCSTDRLHSSPP